MAAWTLAGRGRFACIGRLPSHSIADQIQKISDDGYCSKQQDPGRGLLVQALNEFHLSAFCAPKARPATSARRGEGFRRNNNTVGTLEFRIAKSSVAQ
jgi:hypothetical protein